MVVRLLFIAAAGFGLHQTYRPTLSFGPWGALMRYAIGSLGVWPGTLLLHDGLGDRRDGFTIAYLLACFSFGSGVMLGHLVDRITQ